MKTRKINKHLLIFVNNKDGDEYLYKCPECNENMIWSNTIQTQDENLAHGGTVSLHYCTVCDIELRKISYETNGISEQVINLINRFNLEDYFFVVDVTNEYNSTGDVELHTVNSESAVAIGTRDCIEYILSYIEGVR